MSSRRLVVGALMASLGLAAWVSAQPRQSEQPGGGRPANTQPGQPGGRPGGPGGERRAEGQPESLERLMKTMGRGLRTLKRQAEDPAKRAENLQILGDMQRAAVLAKGMKPHHMPEKEQEAYLDDYRLHQVDLVELMLAAERSLIKADYPAAAKRVAELEEVRDSAHKLFAPDEEEEHEEENSAPGPGRGNTPTGTK